MLFVRSILFHRLLIAGASLLTSGAAMLGAAPVINEFMAVNTVTLADEDGEFSDWIEIYNPDAAPFALNGWYLTGTASNKTKWQFPAVTLPAKGYLVVFASNKNRRDPSKPLHTNFALAKGGDYLGLVQPDGTTVASEFIPTFPPQTDDVSYGIPSNGAAVAYLQTPTPGKANSAARAVPVTDAVTFSRSPGPFPAPFTLELTGAGAGRKIRYVLGAPSATGTAVAKPTSASTLYTGPISITASVVVRAAVFSSDDTQTGPTATTQFVRLSQNLSGFSTSLPVLVLDNHGIGPLEKDGVDHPAWMYVYQTAGATFGSSPVLATPTTMSVRGNYTATFPKKSYSLTLQDTSGTDIAVPLLGLDSAADWALVGPYLTDRTYIRNTFVYALSNRMGRWAPRTKFVEMFLNNDSNGLESADYIGIGVLTDRLKFGPDRIDITNLKSSDNTPPAVTGGYLIKYDPVPDPDHYNFITNHGFPSVPGTGVIVDTPTGNNLTTAQRDYIRGYVQQMEDSLFAAQDVGYTRRAYLDYIDLPSWVDHHLLEVFVGNLDGLTRSEYFYKDRGGKLVSGPAWDFDGTMGYGDSRNLNPNTWDTSGGLDVWSYSWWGPLARDPEFMQMWIDRWQALRRNEFTADSLRSLADTFAAQVGTDAAARDAARWPATVGRFPGGFLGEVAFLKDWITTRATWIDQQWVSAPAVSVVGNLLRFTPVTGAQIAYTLDGSDPRSLGGEIAPNAILTSSTLDVPATANVHARSYRADRKDAFPGSPWSSAAGGDSSSPLSPRGRLVNISSRGVVGNGDNALVAGVVVADTYAKNYLSRAIGPGLTIFGTSGVTPDPQLSLYSSDRVELFHNNGWQTSAQAAQLPAVFRSAGAFALTPGSADSALVTEMAAGSYSIQVTTPTGKTGVGLAELYELDANGRTANLSTRGLVKTGDGILVGGFYVQGPAYKRMLIRAVGPTLQAFGLANPLRDLTLTLYSGQTVLATNDRWSVGENAKVIAAASKSVGAFDLPDNSADAALLITVPPGPYSVEVSGKGGTEGVALLEIYEVP